MLHNCDAGEYSVITVYPSGFVVADPMEGFSAITADIALIAMRWKSFTGTMPVHNAGHLAYNDDTFEKPYESPVISAGFMFSYGHLIENAGYSQQFDHVFNWEEPFQAYLAWKAGYRFYAPNQ